MRNYIKTVGALAAASTLVAGSASAELEGEVHVGYANMYEFRFVDFGDDLVYAGADIGYDWNGLNLSAGAWYGSVNDDLVGDFNELDLYGGIGYSAFGFDFEVGYIFYHFMDVQGADTQEVYVSAGYEFDFGLSFSSTYYYDFDAFNGYYWDNSIGYSFAFNDCLSLDLGAGFAIADGHGAQVQVSNGGTRDGYQGYYVTAALPWEFREGVTITPYVKYTDADSDLATNFNALSSESKDHFIAGVSIAVGF